MKNSIYVVIKGLVISAIVFRLLPTPRVGAQIVNVLKPVVGEEPDGVAFNAGESLNGAGGNTDKMQLTADLGFRFKSLPHTFLVAGSTAYGLTSDEIDTQRAFGHIRYRWRFYDPVSLFSFVQLSHNRFQLLTLRIVMGLGPEIRLFRTEYAEWHFGIAVMPEWEELAESLRDQQGFAFRLSSFVTQAYQINEWLTLANTTFLQPKPDEMKDYRLLNDSVLTFQITDYLAFNTSASIAFDNVPPTDVKKLDWLIAQGLKISLELRTDTSAEEKSK